MSRGDGSGLAVRRQRVAVRAAARAGGARAGARRRRGFTLLELLVAIALMAVLAVLCWRGLDAVLRGRERIQATSNDTRRLVTAFAQLEEDLRRSWPARRLGLEQFPLVFLPADNDGPPGLAMLRVGVGEEAGRVQRVVYRVRSGVFERGFGAWRASLAGGGDVESVVALTWQPLVDGVAAVEYRGWVETRKAWISGEALTRLPPPTVAATGGAPYGGISGIELVLIRGDARFVRLFAVED